MNTRPKATIYDGEPRLRELLDDPILETLLRHDRLSRGELMDTIAAARARLGNRDIR